MRCTDSQKLPLFWIYYCVITGSLMLLQVGYFGLCYLFPSFEISWIHRPMAEVAFTTMLAYVINSLLLLVSSIFFIVERRWFIAFICLSAVLAYFLMVWKLKEQL